MPTFVKHTTIKDIKFKDQTYIPIHSECTICMKEKSHSTACVTGLNNLGLKRTYFLPVTSLHRYFNEFDMITEDDIEESMIDGDNYSIYNLSDCGNLEPDGFDEFGFPSKTLAIM